ncbi:hypothetical protein IEQ34_009244 [Dendrobium chrysotoxum]|uniref:Ubiquitin-like protease family profile domain-containing protein n=1 Tax=Dendrobium chrysotoxum TaxID=161865 RepID=A0AAV7GIQ5_DENCH|nr:hypothetical protein IEQ34_009244 [Dendrobium chrysotoxum]
MREKENRKLQGIDKFLFEHFPTTYTAYQMGNYSDSTSRTISEHNVVSPEAANTPEDVTQPKSAEEAHEVVDNDSNEITKQEGQQDAVDIAANEITELEALQEVLDITKEINKPEDQEDFTEIATKEITNPEEAQNIVDIAVKELTKPEEEKDMGFASSSHTGITRRVQRQVTTPNIEVDTNKGTTEKVPPKSLDIIEVGTESKIEARPAKTALEYGGRTAISDEKPGITEELVGITDDLLDINVKLLGITEELLGITAALVGINRYYRGITRYYRGIGRNDMIYAYGQGYKAYNTDTKGFVSHINKESVSAANLILVPIIKNSHWTLLVGNLKTKISHMYEDITNSFDTYIRGWRIQKIKQAPTQKNSVDCGMYVCKYMEAAIQPEAVVWTDVKDWQKNIAKFRAEFTYAILRATIK